MSSVIIPDFVSLYIPYGYHNGDPVKYQELVSKARKLVQLANSSHQEQDTKR